MTPSVVAAASDTGNSSSPSLTIAPSGVDRLLIVALHLESSRTVNSFDFNTSEALTFIDDVVNGHKIFFYRLIAPSAVSADVDVSLSSGVVWGLGAVAVTETNQTTPIGATNKATGTSVTPSVGVTTVNNNSLVLDAALYLSTQGAAPETVGAGQTERYNDVFAFGPQVSRVNLQGSTEPKATPGLVTMDWTLQASRDWGIIGLEINENGAAPVGPRDNMVDGAPVNLMLDGIPVDEIQGG